MVDEEDQYGDDGELVAAISENKVIAVAQAHGIDVREAPKPSVSLILSRDGKEIFLRRGFVQFGYPQEWIPEIEDIFRFLGVEVSLDFYCGQAN